MTISPALFCQKFFGCGQTLLRDFQIIVAVAKFNGQFCQSNQMFHLMVQRTPAPTAHFFKFSPLFFRHADVGWECFFSPHPNRATIILA
jgi:hypothetical protein